jgi:hypothetical protein
MSLVGDFFEEMANTQVPSLPPPDQVKDVVTAIQTKFEDLIDGTPQKEVGDLIKKLESGDLSPQELWQQLLAALRAIAEQFQLDFAGPARAFDVQDSLEKIAEAINAAESTLQQSRFAIIGGIAELDLKIKLIGDDGPAAKLNLQIAPRPHP